MMNGVSGAMSPSLSGVAAAAPSASAAGGSALGGSLRGVGTVAADAPRPAAGAGAGADFQARLAELKGGLDAAAGMAKQLSDDVSLPAESRGDAAELARAMENLSGRMSAGGLLSLALNLGGAREG
ncbi:hypothetical protein [Chromobacterium violaceum]|uniref:hypothetical protein n=1 Tax=Chromobacterium violaceum TaxID=536 RepID=UPI0009EF98D8|nr:hypothetical protein [Chromobacterium violaceum]MBX9266747.1 hypothetical protein [Chromobacterium violaceum]OQS48962.1 hypothetical protein B0T48_08445 [Chromobacterium violaceum]OQS51486.1 hypothetical protein B0T49_10190 [Chromobacterium violaceum]QRO33736.1 hypothetical protein I6K04_03025 [Chromobacterium violaceum]QRQ16460.1 hypothetical protein I6K03_19705 [Chromobacterium violaceum]